jgi:ankyrin repeat protein
MRKKFTWRKHAEAMIGSMTVKPDENLPRLFAETSRRSKSGRFRYVAPVIGSDKRETGANVACGDAFGHPIHVHFSDNGLGGKIIREETLQWQERFGGQEKLDYDFNKPKAKKAHDLIFDELEPKKTGSPKTITILDDHDISSVLVALRQSRQQSGAQTNMPDDEWSWHRMLKQSEWEGLFDSLIQFKGQRAAVPEEMILDKDACTTVLHVAAWKAPPSLMLLLLDAMTSSQASSDNTITAEARTKMYLVCGDSDGNTPLHLACANLEPYHPVPASAGTEGASDAIDFSVIKNLLLLAPEALEMQNKAGDTPLHLLLIADAFRRDDADFATEAAAEEAIASFLHMAGHLAVTQNNAGCTPLHVAVASHCHERVLVQLLMMSPEAVTVADQQRMLPLHYVAAFGGIPWTFAEQLVRAFPDSICCQTVDGDTPLHLLVANAKRNIHQLTVIPGEEPQSSCDFVDHLTTKLAELLIGAGDEETSPLAVKNVDGFTPLQCCALFDTPIQLTRLLMDHSYPR